MEVVPAGPADPSAWDDVPGITDDDQAPSARAELRIVLVPDRAPNNREGNAGRPADRAPGWLRRFVPASIWARIVMPELAVPSRDAPLPAR